MDPNEADIPNDERVLASISTAFRTVEEPDPAVAPAVVAAVVAKADDDDPDADPFGGLRESLAELNKNLTQAIAARSPEKPADDDPAVVSEKGLKALLKHEDPEIAELARATLETREELAQARDERRATLEAEHDAALAQAETAFMKDYGYTRKETTQVLRKWADMVEADPRASVFSLDEAAARIVGQQELTRRREATAARPSPSRGSPNGVPEPALPVTDAARGGGPKARPVVDHTLTMEQAGDIAMRDGAFDRAFKT